MSNKIKCLLLSDHIDKPTGVGIMSNNIIKDSNHLIDWCQIGGAYKKDKPEIRSDNDKYLVIYPYDTYGDPDYLRHIIELEKPDIILHFTDPRFWIWLYEMEYELRKIYGIPIAYYSIWDNLPIPKWNEPYYRSCDALIAISKLTDKIHRKLVGGITSCYHVPHGVDTKIFFPIIGESTYELDDIRSEFHEKHNCKHIFFWNNKNMKRKNVLTLLEGFAKFYRSGNSDCCLVLHTEVVSPVGTDLLTVKRDLYDDVNIIFSPNVISPEQLNIYYNIVDAVINVSSNEGFGLSTLEALAAGCPIIASKTGGLNDQLEIPGTIGLPVRSVMTGHPNTPYINEDFIEISDLVKAFKDIKTKKLKYNKHTLRSNVIKKRMTSYAMAESIAHILIKTCDSHNTQNTYISEI